MDRGRRVADRDPALTAELTDPRHIAFVNEYLVDLNAAQAYIRAGFAPTTPESAAAGASRLLATDSVRLCVERGKAQRLARVQVTQDQVLQEMSLLANSDLTHYVIDDEGQVRLAAGAPDGAMRAIQKIKRKVKVYLPKGDEPGHKEYDVEIWLWDKPSPLKLMGRHVGLFPDRVEHSGPNGGPIPITEIRSTIVDPKETKA